MTDDDLRHLRRAIELSARARESGDEPFGSLLVGPDGAVLAEDVNTVRTDRDISAHPELKLAVWAARHLDPATSAATTMYTSCENCAMCSAAMVSSGVGRLVFALDGRRLASFRGEQRPGLDLPAADVFARASRTIAVEGPLLAEEALVPHEGFWSHAQG
ncbi:tRNA(Arg) A34 adenosine deaminase TadA [Saccharopolyspora erythraea NRRL 2338]|uniref:Cytidine/deoxycytidylate deaminase, zinc-binding region n=2 Tax=Saccharopolyspora erythraea TaxID=1836 RepID=A4F6G6_SACEN|nr:nucleoside deaminase [Saccharopolyspora erythraea]EQD88095.1 cytidine deaminase [Saccharopolyspora erythraea D]PFG93443.1 tRNA(Arg) A34 adenosine deaminase TadA [Saccharopolyspora erythraea NRRL 2338]QRK90315.1 nucleoside deaminase [Saccharopolyspora erythraea]CAL99640.1 cytidine/deoxycytidylate deaminase, zinc-binding region [Saccharopolyspora erythraea NRRL 2338]